MNTIRKSPNPKRQVRSLWDMVIALAYQMFATMKDGGIANGTTAGQLKTVNEVDFQIAGMVYTKAATDDLWDLSGETDLAAGEYQAFWLYLDSAGAASIDAGGIRASEALALAALPDLTAARSIIGVYIAGPSTDFDDAGGLAAQGTIHDGVPTGVPGKDLALDVPKLVAP